MAEFSYVSTWAQICNTALRMLAAGSIQSLSEGTELANYCKSFLPQAIEDVLGQYPWNSPRRRVQLARESEAPTYGYLYAYRLPTDYINLVHVENDEMEYQPEFPLILTDAEEVRITYVQRPTDPNQLTAGVRKAIASSLALLLTIPLSSNENTANRVTQLYVAHLERAKIDDTQGEEIDTAEDWYGDAR